MKVENMTNKNGNKVPNQFIITDAYNNLIFQSYDTRICIYKNNKLYLYSDMWDYSNTTRKYFKQFVNEYTNFKYEDKQQWLKEIKQNENIEVI